MKEGYKTHAHRMTAFSRFLTAVHRSPGPHSAPGQDKPVPMQDAAQTAQSQTPLKLTKLTATPRSEPLGCESL